MAESDNGPKVPLKQSDTQKKSSPKEALSEALRKNLLRRKGRSGHKDSTDAEKDA